MEKFCAICKILQHGLFLQNFHATFKNFDKISIQNIDNTNQKLPSQVFL